MAQRIFISGISSGIGEALAESHLKEGATVYAMNRSKPERLIKNYSNLFFVECDFRNHEEIPAKLKSVLQGQKSFDCVILNSGILGPLGDFTKTSLSESKGVLNVNLWANKVLLDEFKNLGTQIRQVVAISSGAGIIPRRGWNAYALSKAALNMLIGLYAAEWPDCHFSALAPGIVETPLQELISKAQMPEDTYPSFERLRKARGSSEMPVASLAAPLLRSAISAALTKPTGTYFQARESLESLGSKCQILMQGQLEAYNKGDIEHFLKHYHPQVEVYNLSKPEKPTVKGIRDFRALYEKMFIENPHLNCQLKSRMIFGDFGIDEEWVTGSPRFGNGLHISAIYQVKDELLFRVWFTR